MDKTLQKVLDWIVEECNDDYCQICARLPDSEWEFSPEDIPDDVEPCRFKREGGCDACKKGIADYFSAK